jgi:hypothetical protein
MPGTRARRAREYRAGARSLELIGERPTPPDSVDGRRPVRLKFHRRPLPVDQVELRRFAHLAEERNAPQDAQKG